MVLKNWNMMMVIQRRRECGGGEGGGLKHPSFVNAHENPFHEASFVYGIQLLLIICFCSYLYFTSDGC